MKMMRKKRDAKVANHEGEYMNFTGKIDWKGNRGTVENATFKLDKHGYIWWYEGVWKDGVWRAVACTEGTCKEFAKKDREVEDRCLEQ